MAKREQHETSPGFPTTSAKDYEGIELPPDVVAVRDEIVDRWFKPYNLEVPGYVWKQLVTASKTDGEGPRAEALEKVRQKAELHYLSQWSKGNVNVVDSNAEPMSEETKEYLRNLNKERREKEKLEREERDARKKSLDKAAISTADDKPKKVVAKRSKNPVFNDPDAQKLIVEKYPWAIPGSFRQDPDKPAGTNLDIKCQKCGMARSIHLADAFQVKYCTSCKNGTNAKQTAGVGK